MKITFTLMSLVLLTFVLLTPVGAFADSQVVRKEIETIFARDSRLVMNRDVEGYRRHTEALFAPDFTAQFLDGQRIGREEALKNEMDYLARMTGSPRSEFRVETIKLQGDTVTAMVRAHEDILFTDSPGGPTYRSQKQRRLRYTFTKAESGWQIRRIEVLEEQGSRDGRRERFANGYFSYEKRPLSEDRKMIQGTWELQGPAPRIPEGGRITREIRGDREIYTVYDKDGKVLTTHTVAYSLSDHGPVRVFSYSFIERWVDGKKVETNKRIYTDVYRLEGDTLYAFIGSSADTHPNQRPWVDIWKRVKTETRGSR